jgi:hypothetical protein
VDLVFETQVETEEKITGEAENADDVEAAGADEASKYQFTPRAELESKREAIVKAFFSQKHLTAIKLSKTNFADVSKHLHVTCAISKRYKRDYQPYWYALHPQWVEFLEASEESYFVLGCMDRNEAFAIPRHVLLKILPDLNQTKLSNRNYWHVALTNEDNKIKLNLSSIGKKLDLSPYAFQI